MKDEDSSPRFVESGLLTSYVFLLRQPTQPNIANTIYRFWTCDEVTPRLQGYSLSYELTYDGGSVESMVAEGDGNDTEIEYVSPELDPDDAEEKVNGNVLVSPLYLDPGPNDVVTSYLSGDDSYSECYSCHVTVNPLAAFRNNWDDEGRYLPLSQAGINAGDNNPAYGVFAGTHGHDMRGLGEILADSQDVKDCIIQRTYKLLTGTVLSPADHDEMEILRADFENGSGRLTALGANVIGPSPISFNIKNLYKSIVLSESYRRGF
jgi:hypothetical protein